MNLYSFLYRHISSSEVLSSFYSLYIFFKCFYGCREQLEQFSPSELHQLYGIDDSSSFLSLFPLLLKDLLCHTHQSIHYCHLELLLNDSLLLFPFESCSIYDNHYTVSRYIDFLSLSSLLSTAVCSLKFQGDWLVFLHHRAQPLQSRLCS